MTTPGSHDFLRSPRILAILAAASLWIEAAAQPALTANRQTVGAESVPQRVALVIGNGRYSTGSLQNPARDAQAVAATLAELGFDVETHLDLNQTEMVQRVFDFYHHKAAKSALRLVYYAGHGVQYDGHNYLIPVDANLALPADIPRSSFKLDELRRGLDGLTEGASVVILDTCRVKLCPVGRCRGVMSSLPLLPETKSSGTLIAYSTAPGKPASDGPDADNSLYTQRLVELLPTPCLSVEKLFRRLTEDVFRQSQGLQRPEFVNGLMGDEIFLKTDAAGTCAAP